jgi:hypothetical protein
MPWSYLYSIGSNNRFRFFALDGPMPADGLNNAKPVINALEAYKLDHGQYPVNIDVLLYDHYLQFPRPYPSENYDYEYDPFPSQEDQQEFMLSFRVRRSIGGWYCYYSKDKQWLKSNFSCWSSPRPEKASSE